VPLGGLVMPLGGLGVPLGGLVVPLGGLVVPLGGLVVPLGGLVVLIVGPFSYSDSRKRYHRGDPPGGFPPWIAPSRPSRRPKNPYGQIIYVMLMSPPSVLGTLKTERLS
jgi:hypothetical protein